MTTSYDPRSGEGVVDVDAREHPASTSAMSGSAARGIFTCVDMLEKVGFDGRAPNALRGWLEIGSRLVRAASIGLGSPARPIHVRYRSYAHSITARRRPPRPRPWRGRRRHGARVAA